MLQNHVSAIESIAACLRRIQTEGGSGNFVTFTAKTRSGYYIQFAGENGSRRLFGEAVSNNCLAPEFALDRTRVLRLENMGWKPPLPDEFNFSHEWQAASDDDRMQIARFVRRTFIESYGLTPYQEMDINLVLE
jgi:hypothetical protein